MFKCKPVSPVYWGMKITADGGSSDGGTTTDVTLEDGREVAITWGEDWNIESHADADVAANDFVVWKALDGADAVHTPTYEFVPAEDLSTRFLIVG